MTTFTITFEDFPRCHRPDDTGRLHYTLLWKSEFPRIELDHNPLVKREDRLPVEYYKRAQCFYADPFKHAKKLREEGHTVIMPDLLKGVL